MAAKRLTPVKAPAKKAPAKRAAPAKKATTAAKKATSVAVAVRSGSRRDVLVALRERTAKAIDKPNVHPRDLAALTRQLQDLDWQIRRLEEQR